jgi:hypothetical protein
MRSSRKIALTYFIWSNLIFIAGVSGSIDAFFWGFFSFISDWPFSYVTEEIWKSVVGSPPSIDNTNAFFLGLTRSQCLTYSLDVLAGTAWWWTLALCVGKVREFTRSDGYSGTSP